MEELKHKLEKLSKAYKDTPEKEEKVLIPFIKKLLELPMKERRKLLPVIRDLQWIKSKFPGFSSSETFCSHDRARFLAAPVTGLKQLLELHLELLSNNHSKVTDGQLRQRLQEWTASSNLKKVITSLNNL